MAETPCVHCGKAIGFETGFYHFYGPGGSNLAHAVCEEAYQERQREAGAEAYEQKRNTLVSVAARAINAKSN